MDMTWPALRGKAYIFVRIQSLNLVLDCGKLYKPKTDSRGGTSRRMHKVLDDSQCPRNRCFPVKEPWHFTLLTFFSNSHACPIHLRSPPNPTGLLPPSSGTIAKTLYIFPIAPPPLSTSRWVAPLTRLFPTSSSPRP